MRMPSTDSSHQVRSPQTKFASTLSLPNLAGQTVLVMTGRCTRLCTVQGPWQVDVTAMPVSCAQETQKLGVDKGVLSTRT